LTRGLSLYKTMTLPRPAGIEFDNVNLSYIEDDVRPAFVLNDVRGAGFLNVKAQHAPDVSAFVLNDVEDFSTHRCQSVTDVELESVEQKEL
jgi:hypothetical protein